MEEYKDKILDGTAASNALRESLKPRIAKLQEKKGVVPGLVTILVGDDPASKIYVSYKHKGCKALGINSYEKVLPAGTTERDLMEIVKEYNEDNNIHGILVQSPVPKHIDMERIIACIDPRKDVDGFHPENLGNLLRGNMDGIFVSCTPAGIIYLLKEWGKIELKGLEVVIVNRSNLVGKPLIPLFLRENATVTTCHTKTKDLKFHTKRADLVVTGVGRPKYFTEDYFKAGVIVVDVGISRTEKGVCGDVDFEKVVKIASKITPVPGGVGPMTIAMLLSNTVTSAERLSS